MSNGSMRCPRCTKYFLEPRKLMCEVEVDYCKSCKGIWFDCDELEKISDVAIRKLRSSGDARDTDLACPRCDDRTLRASHYPQTFVTMDTCDACHGLWLDGGEFKEVVAVRSHLRETGELQEYAPVTGFKGSLLRFIEESIEALWSPG